MFLIKAFLRIWYPPNLTAQQQELAELNTAREELLCLYSWFNELSGRDCRFNELAYRLLAAEIHYQDCLQNLQLKGIHRQPVPYTPEGPRRGITCGGCWYGW